MNMCFLQLNSQDLAFAEIRSHFFWGNIEER